jgi:hypothetical protein
MSNVISLADRRRAPPAPPPVIAPEALGDVPGFAQFGFAHSMVGQALAFYASQGFDHGTRARAALFAMNEALAPTSNEPEQA